MIVTKNQNGDYICEHGITVDVHCCNCHSGFLFDIDSCVCWKVEKTHKWEFYMNGTFCSKCGVVIGSGIPCK